MSSFVYGNKTYQYSVEFLSSRKKTISIHVLPNAMVEVKAPSYTDKQKIVDTMKKKARWVVKHIEHIQNNNVQILPRKYISGETHFYMGRRYQLKVIHSGINQVKLVRGRLMIESMDTGSVKIKSLLEAWYKKHALQTFTKRLAAISANMGWPENIPPMTVRSMKKRWGSCSISGHISLNWNLVKAPLDCIDYVITHEICHLREHNHSKRFYALQEQYNFNWKAIKFKLDNMAEALLTNMNR